MPPKREVINWETLSAFWSFLLFFASLVNNVLQQKDMSNINFYDKNFLEETLT